VVGRFINSIYIMPSSMELLRKRGHLLLPNFYPIFEKKNLEKPKIAKKKTKKIYL